MAFLAPHLVRSKSEGILRRPSRGRPLFAPAEKVAEQASAMYASASSAARCFELVEGSSNKFWEVARDGCSVTVRFGRIGAGGQAKTKLIHAKTSPGAMPTALIEEKLAKGYRESGEA